MTYQVIICTIIDINYLFSEVLDMIIHQEHNSLSNHTYNAFFYENCEWFYHFHKNYELTYVQEGEVELTLNETKYLLKAGDYAFVLPHEFHSYHTPSHSIVWIGVFSADFVGEFGRITKNKRAKKSIFVCEPEVNTYLKKYLIVKENPNVFVLKSALYAACSQFLKTADLYDITNEKDFVYDISSYISTHFQQEITLASIAEILGYEYHYLSRQFHHHFHMNFKQFLNIYRIDYAKEQLLHTQNSITEIALNSGFQNMRSFNRVFLEQTGVTPSEYRKK